MAGRKDVPEGHVPDGGVPDGAVPEGKGDIAFSLFDRQERIFRRLDKKIGNLDTRVTALEKRGRS